MEKTEKIDGYFYGIEYDLQLSVLEHNLFILV